MLLLLVHHHMSLCRHGLPHALGGGAVAAACMRACEKERAQGGSRACVGPRSL